MVTKHRLWTKAQYALFTAFIISLIIIGCRTHKPFTTDLSVGGLQNRTLGVARAYNGSIRAVQEAILDTFTHFGNRVNVEGALVDDAYFERFSYLLAQGVRTQVQLYKIDMEKPMVFRATYPTHQVVILNKTIVKENIHRVYFWVEALSEPAPKAASHRNTVAKTRVRMLIDEEPPHKEYQISPRWPKYTEAQFLDYMETLIPKSR